MSVFLLVKMEFSTVLNAESSILSSIGLSLSQMLHP
jgi:hypothetical protein